MSVLFDVQGIQSLGHGQRGIARYVLELALALERSRPNPVAAYILNPDLPVPSRIDPLTHGLPLRFSDRLPAASVYHVGSPIDLSIPLERLWPARAWRELALVVTLYDLIPLLFPDIYLADGLTRLQYQSRVDLVRKADRILAISEATGRDAVEHLGVPPERITVVGAGVSDRFRPPVDRRSAFESLRRALPWIDPGYVLYTGGIEPRKNIPRLLDAYAALPPDVTSRRQLVVVCRVLPTERLELSRRLDELGVTGRVHFPGFLPDEQLVLLYQAADLFIFPSLYEGYGFPVAEAMACGAPVIASATSALTELVPDPAAQFDPRSTKDMRDALERALTHEELRKELASRRLPLGHTWPEVAKRTVAAYEDVLGRPRRRHIEPRRRIAFVTPLPPQRSGIADESFRLLTELAQLCEVDVFVDGAGGGHPVTPPGTTVHSLASFGPTARVRFYDRVFYCLGNSEFHAGALALLRRRPGVVIAHEVRLTGLYARAADIRPDSVPDGFYEALQSMYRDRISPELGRQGAIDFWEADEQGIFMAREVVSLSERFLVHSNHAAQLAKLDASAEDEYKVETIPYGMHPPKPRSANGSLPPTVGSFGIVSPAKQSEKVVLAWPHVRRRHPEARLVVVGSDVGSGENARLAALARELSVDDSVDVRGDVDEASFERAIRGTDVAVQLRGGSNGETSAVVARCLSAGTPAVITNIGSGAELPDSCVAKVERDASPEVLAAEISALLDDRPRRLAMGAAGHAYAAVRTHDRVARILFQHYVCADDLDVALRERIA